MRKKRETQMRRIRVLGGLALFLLAFFVLRAASAGRQEPESMYTPMTYEEFMAETAGVGAGSGEAGYRIPTGGADETGGGSMGTTGGSAGSQGGTGSGEAGSGEAGGSQSENRGETGGNGSGANAGTAPPAQGGQGTGSAGQASPRPETPAVPSVVTPPATANPPATPALLPAAPSSRPDDWRLISVSMLSPLPEDFSPPELTQLKNGHAIDSRAYPDLQAMMDDCRAQGLSPVICSSYRTREYQQNLYDSKVRQFLSRGMSRADAEAEAARVVAPPGTSEHETGLAVDIVDINYQLLDENQMDTKVQKWLMENSYKYGFVLRYPPDKSDLTGIIFEPWHYRYVGREAALDIYEKGICLEEYLSEAE